MTINSVTTNVPAYDPSAYGIGVAVGTVTNGGVYSYMASGYCVYDAFLQKADANGRDSVSGSPVDCSFAYLDMTNSVCPSLQCFSLVGKVQ